MFKKNNNATVNAAAREAEGKRLVNEFISGIKVKLGKAHTVEEAVQQGDEARTSILGRLDEMLNGFDKLGIRMAKAEFMVCLEKCTVNNKTDVLKLGRALDMALCRIEASIEEDVQECIKNGYEPKVAMEKLAVIRCAKNNGTGHSVGGALARALLYVAQATINKVSKWLGLQAEGTIWGALGKALKCMAGLAKVGIAITKRVVQGVVCYAAAGATKLAQLFMKAFYFCVGSISEWNYNRKSNVDARAEAAADELYDDMFSDEDIVMDSDI